jgi:7-cyano-7-deazaguanine synthase in queuosine biosynthesis/intein/homing endonuclease
MIERRAVVLLSGGLDSATVLAIARSEGYACYALSVAYGQRHSAELDAAARVAESLGAREHRTMRVDLANIGGSALTDLSIAVPETPTEGIPPTYVPARNTIMLSLAMAWAEVLQAQAIYVGVNALDYSVSGDARVWVRDRSGARLIPMREACALPPDEYETIAVDPSTLQLGWHRILARMKHDVSQKRCFKVTLERGQQVEVTEDHSLFTLDDHGRVRPIRGADIVAGMPLIVPYDLSALAYSWREDLRVVDLRALRRDFRGRENATLVEDEKTLTNRLRRTHIPLDFPVTDEFLRVMGLWLAEGGKDPAAVSATLAWSIGALPRAVELLRDYFRDYGITLRKSPLNDFDYHITSSVAYELFRRLDLFGTSKAGDKHFPSWFWRLSQRQRRIVVAGLWDGDGCQVSRGEAPIFQKSRSIIEDLYHCLLLDGIFATRKSAHDGQTRLAITRAADLQRFGEQYPLWHGQKLWTIQQAGRKAGRDKTIGLWKFADLWATVYVSELLRDGRSKIYNAGGKYEGGFRAQRKAFSDVPILKELVDSRLAFLRVAKIETTTHESMYDFSVEGAENFLADGVLAHNSGYPDCRPEYIDAFKTVMSLATKAAVEGRPCEVRAPLISWSKADIIRAGTRLGVDYSVTVSCYQADGQGRACGRCDSCRIRQAGFAAAGVPDPTRYGAL